jgi:hypothetical protein
MNGDNLLVDTNIFIALLDNRQSVVPFVEYNWHFSFITEIELLGKPGIKPTEVKAVRDLLSICTKLNHIDPINQLAIQLKQKSKIKTPDALIAASAIYSELPLLTFDKDFSKIDEITLILL